MEKYYDFLRRITNEKIDITKLYLLWCLNNTLYSQEETWKIVNYCYDLWLDTDDVDLDLGKLADIVIGEWEKIKKGETKDYEIIEECSWGV